MKINIFILLITLQILPLQGQINSIVWNPDIGDGNYRNPVIYADYSDPDVIRVDDLFYMTSSSFNCSPGLPILESPDLVNWTIIGHALKSIKPLIFYDKPQHGCGVWAPSLRFHNNEFYIYYGDPDFGIFLVKAKEITGPWTEPILVKEAKGWIDPCPFWDDDGNAYLVHAWAGSRAGIKSILTLNKMNLDGTEILDNGVLIFDGHKNQPTIEGPKIYKRNEYYYIFAPAGGVKTGWQLVLRSKQIYGPYEEKIVLHQGNTLMNGPHQGAWIETGKNESWFIHFQDLEAYGRVVLLEPMQWKEDWPVIGIDTNNDGIGEPIEQFKKPIIKKEFQSSIPQSSDEFNSSQIGLQWQWHANFHKEWDVTSENHGFLRLNAILPPEGSLNLWNVPNLLLQKFPAPSFTVSSKISFNPHSNNDKIGLLVMGSDYAYIGITLHDNKLIVCQTTCLNADKGNRETINDSIKITNGNIILKVSVTLNAKCDFSFSSDGINFVGIGKQFQAKPGKWIGAKIGLFCLGEMKTDNAGYADIDWFRIEK